MFELGLFLFLAALVACQDAIVVAKLPNNLIQNLLAQRHGKGLNMIAGLAYLTCGFNFQECAYQLAA